MMVILELQFENKFINNDVNKKRKKKTVAVYPGYIEMFK